MKKSFTLIEIIIFIIVFSVGVMGILALFHNSLGKIYDPTIRIKGVQIAQSVMEEIYGKAFDNDSYAADNGTINLLSANIGREEISDNISDFDDVDDFIKCNTGSNCPCTTTNYDSTAFNLAPNYTISIKVSYAKISGQNIVEECSTAQNLKLITVTVKPNSLFLNENYTVKFLKGNY
ncbi:MAG: hypothetical protein N3C60_08680 [Calditerrivibrio sp.]|nr:hypothetical protein [Calditerrivibrio sp.]